MNTEEAKVILVSILDSMKSPDNAVKIQDALKLCGNDMLKRMQIVYPVLVKIQIDVIKKYGYSNDSDGLLKFCHEIAVLEKESEEVLTLNNELREIFIPKIPDIA